MRIELEVRRFLDLEALARHLPIVSFRVWTHAQFKQPAGWTPPTPALIDTGAPFCVLPKALWTMIEHEGGFPTSLRGLVQLPSAILNARLARITCVVSDRAATSRPLKVWALLAEGDVPLVLGCAGFLEHAKFVLEPAHQHAWLEF